VHIRNRPVATTRAKFSTSAGRPWFEPLQVSAQSGQRAADAFRGDRPHILIVLLQNTPRDPREQNEQVGESRLRCQGARPWCEGKTSEPSDRFKERAARTMVCWLRMHHEK
jgi:hypothetical protein